MKNCMKSTVSKRCLRNMSSKGKVWNLFIKATL
ncbi:unnamed protein product [Larinioides sclopetarius]|uniref:Ribosomal protein L32 n=1 Tax=Larinioides sclopetarius TaxID=280406 RepID=A0AAV1ZM31_9ARAC